ncbi:MAG: bactofilin family protein [Chitinophagaceae bacterium]|jgi:cytoskeletal protein CcmA (bactofilin family)
MSIFSSNKESKDPTPSYTPPPQPAHSAPAPVSSYGSSGSGMTSISEGTVLDGQIKIEGDIRIEGIIKGTVTSKGKVIISPSGKIDGDIICQNAEISGHVTGKLKVADILILREKANIEGDINTGKLVIENGVKFNGNCSMGAAAVSTAATPKVEHAVKPANMATANA